MSAATTRLNLTKPGGGSTGLIMPPDPVDIDVLNANFDKIDASIGTNWYSSTTRPALSFDGQSIMESDTGGLAVYRTALGQWVYPNPVPVIADLNSLPSASQFEGRRYHIDAMNVDFQAIDNVWVQDGIATFVDAAARDAEYAKAAGAYKVSGAQAKIATELWPRRYSGTNWRPYVGGASQAPLLPSAVGGTGVSIDAATGRILFSNAGAITLTADGLFSGDFTNYEFDLDIYSGISGAVMKLRSGGSTDSSANYDRQLLYGFGATAVGSQSLAQTSWGIVGLPGGAGAYAKGVILSPNAARETRALVESGFIGNPMTSSNAGVEHMMLGHRLTTQFTGLQIEFSSAASGSLGIRGIL